MARGCGEQRTASGCEAAIRRERGSVVAAWPPPPSPTLGPDVTRYFGGINWGIWSNPFPATGGEGRIALLWRELRPGRTVRNTSRVRETRLPFFSLNF